MHGLPPRSKRLERNDSIMFGYNDPESDDYHVLESNEIGTVAYINPVSRAVGVVTAIGQRKLFPIHQVSPTAQYLGAYVVVRSTVGEVHVMLVSEWLDQWHIEGVDDSHQEKTEAIDPSAEERCPNEEDAA
jgi:hypothetical protein